MELLGPKNLTNSELLSIIIKTGTKDCNCLKIAQNILTSNKDINRVSELEYLSMLSISELQKFKGIGKIKAIEIVAVIELAKRIGNEFVSIKKDKITSPKDVFDIVKKDYVGIKNEVLKIIILNRQNKVLSIINIEGMVDRVMVNMKHIFSEPIKQLASSIILCHNHPGGSMVPSKYDIELTRKVLEYGKIFEISLIDHIIVVSDKFVSLKELGYI